MKTEWFDFLMINILVEWRKLIFICSHACEKNKLKSKANLSSSLHLAYHLIFLSCHVTLIKTKKKSFNFSNLMVQIEKLSRFLWKVCFSNKINQKKIRSIFFFWNFWTLSISKLSKHKQINFGIESRELEKNQPTNKTNADKVK